MVLFRSPLALLAAAASAALAAGCADHQTTDPALSQAQTITALGIRGRIAVLADDSMRGRLTPSPELDKAAAWAVAEFQGSGLGPGLVTGFLQTWPAPGGPAPNVVGVLEGSDPALRFEYVVFVAHLDHIGTAASGGRCAATGADSICNGADDNASGAAAVLELAHAFGGLRPRPRRSLLFLLVSGEEEGLLGSAYYVANPAVPLAQTVAAINLDMIGRNATDSVLVIGMGLTTLGAQTGQVWSEHPELGMRPVGVGYPYGGSDHISFGGNRVPVLGFFSGLHPDYHRPSDTVDRIDADKTARIVRLVYYLGLQVANRTDRPAWYGATPAPAQRDSAAPL
jgi:hypothetical protein